MAHLERIHLKFHRHRLRFYIQNKRPCERYMLRNLTCLNFHQQFNLRSIFEFQRELWVPSRSRDEVYGHGCSGRPRCANSGSQVHTSSICSRVLFSNLSELSQNFYQWILLLWNSFQNYSTQTNLSIKYFIFDWTPWFFFQTDEKLSNGMKAALQLRCLKKTVAEKNAQINEMWYFQWWHPRPGRRVRSRLVNLHSSHRRNSRARRQTPLSQVSSIAFKIVSHLLPQWSQVQLDFSAVLEKKLAHYKIRIKGRICMRRLTLFMEIIWKKEKKNKELITQTHFINGSGTIFQKAETRFQNIETP